MTTTLTDDTIILRSLAATEGPDCSMDGLSRAALTRLALQVKAEAYDRRITMALTSLANDGADVNELAWAAGLSQDDVLSRLPRDLLNLDTLLRLDLDPRPVFPAPDAQAAQIAAEVSQAIRSSPEVDPAPQAEPARTGWFGGWWTRRG